MSETKYKEDLKEIREIMERSSRFISLSGWSGIAAGITALLGLYLAYQAVYEGQDYLGYRKAYLTKAMILEVIFISVATVGMALGLGILFTTRKSKKQNQKIWSPQVKRLLIEFFIPMITGGVVCLIFLFKGFIGVLAPLTLIFYGLALLNASKYTISEVRSLGIAEICLGLCSLYFIGYGLIFWALGFGVLHIVYGALMQVKYKG